jgi:hypothetical protein
MSQVIIELDVQMKSRIKLLKQRIEHLLAHHYDSEVWKHDLNAANSELVHLTSGERDDHVAIPITGRYVVAWIAFGNSKGRLIDGLCTWDCGDGTFFVSTVADGQFRCTNAVIVPDENLTNVQRAYAKLNRWEFGIDFSAQ